jgi:hypothetical protein
MTLVSTLTHTRMLGKLLIDRIVMDTGYIILSYELIFKLVVLRSLIRQVYSLNIGLTYNIFIKDTDSESLQLLNQGKWIGVKPIRNAFVVNLAETLSVSD